jgi:hypothetical protein
MDLLHASKFVNILNSGMLTTDRIAKITKMTLERQETEFWHLTRVAEWVQQYVLICEKEVERAMNKRTNPLFHYGLVTVRLIYTSEQLHSACIAQSIFMMY